MYKNDHFLYRIVDSFCRHWRIFVLAFVCVTGVVGGALYSRSQSFTASAATQVISDTGMERAVGLPGSQGNTWVSLADQNSQHFRDLLRDNLPGGFVETALKNANLDRPINIDPAADDKRLDLLIQRLKVASESSTVFTLYLTWDNPKECEALLAAFQKQYIDEAGSSHQASSIAVTQYLKSEIAKYGKRMGEAEALVIAYKQKHSGELPEAQLKQIEQLSVLQTQLDQLRITAQDNVLKQQELELRLSRIKPESIKERTLGTSPIALEVRDFQARRHDLIARGSLTTSELVTAMDRRIARLQKQMDDELKADPTSSKYVTETTLEQNPEYRELAQQLTQVKINRKTQAAQMALVQAQIDKYNTSIARIPAAEKELTDKTRDYTILKKQYEDLLARRESANLRASLERITESSTFKPIGRIFAESTAGAKKTIMTFAGSAILGLLVGFVLVLLSEWLDPSLRYAADTYRLLGVPVLVSLPENKDMRFLPGAPNAALPASTPAAITGSA